MRLTLGHWLLSLAFLLGCCCCCCARRYEATWASLDSRPRPPWFDQAKVGIFIHWGVFSVPSFGSAWLWKYWQEKQSEYIGFMEKNYRPGFTYQDFAPMFTAEFYDPDYWADVINASGARYVVPTSKHHEGYTIWPSNFSWNWNSMDVGPKRDLLGDLAKSIRQKYPHIHFGVYYSLYEWFNPLYERDAGSSFATNQFVVTKTMPELLELVQNYQPEIIWSDGEWEALDWYWNSTIFLAWLFNDSPVKDTVVVNDRWGLGTRLRHGSFYSGPDRFNPGVLQHHKWENCMTLDKKAWTHRRNARASDFMTIHELLTELAQTISCGGNILVNIGPTHDGVLPPIMEERLRQLGSWLSINGEAIYSSAPWQMQNDTLTPGVWYTCKDKFVYGIVLFWPSRDSLTLGSLKTGDKASATLLGMRQPSSLKMKMVSKGLQIAFPPRYDVTGSWAWVLKMEGIVPVM